MALRPAVMLSPQPHLVHNEIYHDHQSADLNNIFQRYQSLEQCYSWDYMPLNDLENELKTYGSVTSIPYTYSVCYDSKEEFAESILTVCLDLNDQSVIDEYRPDVTRYADHFKTSDGKYTITINARIIDLSVKEFKFGEHNT